VGVEKCCVTGIITDCIPRKSVFSDSTTFQADFKAPESKFCSIDVAIGLKYKWERCSSFICTPETFYVLDRQSLRDQVFREEMPPVWIGYATTSYKKHGAFRNKINKGSQRFWLFENNFVNCSDMTKVKEVWDRLCDAQKSGIGRSVLESLVCPAYIMDIVGIHKWVEFEKWALPLYKTPLYSFMCYLLPSQEELKKEVTEENEQL
jgi:hypothetical protein